MKKSIKISIAILILVMSCKADKKKETNSEESIITEINEEDVKSIDENFNIKLAFSSNEEGLLQIQYNSEQLNQWEKKYFTMKKSEEQQTAEAKFDLNKFGQPKVVRFILGDKPKLIELEEFIISADGNVLEINGSNFEQFISFNEYINYDNTTNTIKTITVDSKHIPIMGLTKRALDSLSY